MHAPKKMRGRLTYQYDGQADVLYVTIGASRASYCDLIENGVLLKLDGRSDAVCGATILDFLKRKPEEVQRLLPFHVNLSAIRRQLAAPPVWHPMVFSVA